jgi:hypothetical protein
MPLIGDSTAKRTHPMGFMTRPSAQQSAPKISASSKSCARRSRQTLSPPLTLSAASAACCQICITQDAQPEQTAQCAHKSPGDATVTWNINPGSTRTCAAAQAQQILQKQQHDSQASLGQGCFKDAPVRPALMDCLRVRTVQGATLRLLLAGLYSIFTASVSGAKALAR